MRAGLQRDGDVRKTSERIATTLDRVEKYAPS
jgi:hypothetical protein